MNQKRFLLLSLVALLCLGLLAQTSIASAKRDRISRGEAMSVLHTLFTGRLAVLFSPGNGIGAYQFTNFQDVAHFPSPADNGSAYCELDHQAAMLGFLTGSAANRKEAEASLSLIKQEFRIDGQLQETTRTPVVRGAMAPHTQVLYGYNEGVIIAPGDLNPGVHTFEVAVSYDGEPWFVVSNHFYIDAAGTGVCQ